MKITLQTISCVLATWLSFYFFGAFYAAAWNISEWTEFTRFTVVFFGGLASAFVVFVFQLARADL